MSALYYGSVGGTSVQGTIKLWSTTPDPSDFSLLERFRNVTENFTSQVLQEKNCENYADSRVLRRGLI